MFFDQTQLADKYYTFWSATISLIILVGLLVALLLFLILIKLKDIERKLPPFSHAINEWTYTNETWEKKQ